MAQGTTPLPCIDDVNSYRNCLTTLEAKCPDGLMVKQLIGLKANGRNKSCFWVAMYVKEQDRPIPRNETRQMILLLRRSGCPEDGLLKMVGHSKMNDLEGVFVEWRKVNCKCGFFRLTGNRNVPKNAKMLIENNSPFTLPTFEFLSGFSQNGCISDTSLIAAADDFVWMTVFAALACCQWEKSIIERTVTDLCFIGSLVKSNAVVIGGVCSPPMLCKYFSEILKQQDHTHQTEIRFSIDDYVLEMLEVYGETEGNLIDSDKSPLKTSPLPFGNDLLYDLLNLFMEVREGEHHVSPSPNDCNEHNIFVNTNRSN